MAGTRVAYQSRLCWWCGSQLAVNGVKKVKDPLGHEHPVHGLCFDWAAEDIRTVTAMERQLAPRDWER